ncbi:Protein tyrosine phosphatase type IVA 1 [Globomyces sp. JEL0801]|nr:Protein tyrosine phosphatase type IVA 1 [Globomyces sp. JEL0801]
MKKSTSHSKLPNQLSLVEYNDLKFLIFDAPSPNNIDTYISQFKSYNVTDVVRVCEPTYDRNILESAGINVHDWAYPDGDAPPANICANWLDLIEKRFKVPKEDGKSHGCIGIHCVAGLGRAPALVALALIESGMAPLDSVIYVRERRRGAINAKQLKFLEAYKRTTKVKKGCLIM